MRALLLALSVAGSLEVGRTNQGRFFWHGHDVRPPYVATVQYRIESNGDTTWTGSSINGLSLQPLQVPVPHNPVAVAMESQSSTDCLVYWKGIRAPMGALLRDPNPIHVEPTPKGVHGTFGAGETLGNLDAGRIVVVSQGTLTAPMDLLPEIDSLVAGFDTASKRVNNEMRKEFLKPEPLDSLKARMSK